MKRIILGMLLLLLSFMFVACGDSESTTNEDAQATDVRDTLVVGMEAAYAPFNWTVSESNAFDGAVQLNGSSNYVDGYDVMVASYIADALDLELVIKAVEWDGLIPSLVTSEEIDLIIAGMSPTAQRAQTVAFTSEYYASTHVVVLRSDSAYANATSIDDFDQASVVAQISTIYDDLASQLTNATHENPLSDVPTIITAINQGTYDLTILELPVAMAVVETNPNLTYITFGEGNGFDVSYEDAVVSIALRLDESDLLDDINTVLESLTDAERETMMAEALSRQP